MTIRKMTADEIRAALRHGADVCIEMGVCDWGGLDVLPKEEAYRMAMRVMGGFSPWNADSPEHAATFLLLVAEAL